MKHKVIVFDLDNTLAPRTGGISPENIEKIRFLQKEHFVICCSGKTTDYLNGFFRCAGLPDMILMGENGSVIQYGITLPPKKFYLYPVSERSKQQIEEIKTLMEPFHFWSEPNIQTYTIFPGSPEKYEMVRQILSTQYFDELTIYPLARTFDCLYKEISKGNGCRYFAQLEGLSSKDFIGVGDALNDLSMFDYVDLSIGLTKEVQPYTDLHFENITQVLDYLIENE